MTTRLSSVFIVAFFSLALFACKRNIRKGEGAKGSSSPSVSTFNAIDIDLSVKANITVQPGAQPSVHLSGYKNLIDHIKTTVKDNTLYITSELEGDMWVISGEDVIAEITVPSLNGLSLSGAPDADIHGNITGQAFALDISGSSKVVIDNMTVDTFTSDGSGVAHITVKAGSVKSASYDLSGAGSVEAFPLQSDETAASISGTGKCEITAMKKLDADISGAGSIKYKGHPTVSQEVSGVGSITNVD